MVTFTPNRALAVLSAAILLASCDTARQLQKELPNAGGKAASSATAAQMPAPFVRPLLQITDTPIAGRQVSRRERSQRLPSRLEASAALQIKSPQPMSLREIATELSARLAVPVRLVDGAEKPVPSKGQQSAAASVPPVAAIGLMDLPPPAATTGLLSSGMVIEYRGKTSTFLDMLSGHFEVAWRYEAGAIEIYRYSTRSWTLPPAGQTATLTATIGNQSSSGSGNSQASSVSTGAGQSTGATPTNASMQTQVTTKTDFWTEFSSALKGVVGDDGTFSLAPSTGSVTVTAPPAAMRRAERLVQTHQRNLRRQVTITTTLIAYDQTDSDDAALDLTAMFNANGLALSFQGPRPLAGTTGVGGYNVGVMNPPASAPATYRHWAGTNLAIQALASEGKISLVKTTSLTTANFQPAALTESLTEGYLAAIAVSPGTGLQGATQGLTPGSITSGLLLQFTPRVFDDGAISLALNIKHAERPQFNTISSGEGTNRQSIQTPIAPEQATIQFPILRSGQTIVITGFTQDRDELQKQGTATPDFWFFGGGVKGSKQRRNIAILLTPIQVDTMAAIAANPG